MRTPFLAVAVAVLALAGCVHGRRVAEPVPPPTEENLAAFVKARFPEVKGCYQAGLRIEPGLRGKVAVRFTVQPDGTLADVAAPADSLRAPGVTACILDAVRTWRTPFRPGAPTTVEYPFVFTPEG
jgi:TonB family protein